MVMRSVSNYVSVTFASVVQNLIKPAFMPQLEGIRFIGTIPDNGPGLHKSEGGSSVKPATAADCSAGSVVLERLYSSETPSTKRKKRKNVGSRVEDRLTLRVSNKETRQSPRAVNRRERQITKQMLGGLAGRLNATFESNQLLGPWKYAHAGYICDEVNELSCPQIEPVFKGATKLVPPKKDKGYRHLSPVVKGQEFGGVSLDADDVVSTIREKILADESLACLEFDEVECLAEYMAGVSVEPVEENYSADNSGDVYLSASNYSEVDEDLDLPERVGVEKSTIDVWMAGAPLDKLAKIQEHNPEQAGRVRSLIDLADREYSRDPEGVLDVLCAYAENPQNMITE